MKVYKICLLIVPLILSNISCYGQFSALKLISDEADGTQSIYAADLDGDLYKDVLSANKFENSITWYKNGIESGSFGPEQSIASLNQPKSVYAADLDGDGDNDVLATAPFEDLLVWYENLDGLGNFSSQKIIYDGAIAGGAFVIKAGDIDGDDDLDILLGADSGVLSWFENLDGQGNFSERLIINFNAPNSRSLVVVDIDGDSDLDVVGATSGSVTVSWYENLDGQGNFGSQQVIAGSALAVSSVFSIDLDGDNDNDVLASTNAEDKVAWFENLDGSGSFGNEQVLSTNAETVISIFAADLDNDNDNDVISGSFSDGKVAIYENLDGLGTFSDEQVVTNTLLGLRQIQAVDIDNDGDVDLLSASQNDDTLAWYENETILDVNDLPEYSVKILPNPTRGTLQIISKEPILQFSVFNIIGQIVIKGTGDVKEIDVSTLPSGLLFLNLETIHGEILQRVIKE